MAQPKYISLDQANDRLEDELGRGVRLSDTKLQSYAESVGIRCPVVSGRRMVNLSDFLAKFDVLFSKIASREDLGRENQRIGSLMYNTLILAVQEALTASPSPSSVADLWTDIISKANDNIKTKVTTKSDDGSPTKTIRLWTEPLAKSAFQKALDRRTERTRISNSAGASRYIDPNASTSSKP